MKSDGSRKPLKVDEKPVRIVNCVSTFIENLIKSLDAVGTVVKTTLSSPE